MKMRAKSIITCCYECADRRVGCHSVCKQYLAEAEQRQKENARNLKEKGLERQFRELKKRRRRK